MLVSKAPFTVRFQDGNHAPIPCFAVCVKVRGGEVGKACSTSDLPPEEVTEPQQR